jgi:hypothetical protein
VKHFPLLFLALMSSTAAHAGDTARERALRLEQLAPRELPPEEYARKAEALRLEAIRRLEALLAEANGDAAAPGDQP